MIVRPSVVLVDPNADLQAAFNSIALTGGILRLGQGTFSVPNGIDFHSTVGESNNTYIIEGSGAKETIIQTNNAAISLDLGGRNRVVLRNLGIVDIGTTAQVGIARYRDTTLDPPDGHGHLHTYENVYMEGKWSKAAIYSIGSEVNTHTNLEVRQNGNGAGYYSAPTDLLSVDALTTGTVSGGSNTVNNFYGGSIVSAPGTTGGAVSFGVGIADQVNFFGTYLVGWSGGYNVKFVGNPATDAMQGFKVFQGVRFEGTTDAILCTADQVQDLIVRNCTFGQNPGLDINYTNTPSGRGAENWVIENNTHYDRGMTIPVITSSRIVIRDTSVYHATVLTVNSHIQSSYIESSGLTLGGSCNVWASELAHVDGYNGRMRRRFGPNSKASAGNAQGSVIVNRPFGTAPETPEGGSIVTSGVSAWDASAVGAAEDFPAFYDGALWKAMTPIEKTVSGPTANGAKGTICYDANFLYVAVALNTWLRIPATTFVGGSVDSTVSYEDDYVMYEDEIVTY